MDFSTSLEKESPEQLVMGTVVKTHGVRGELKIRPSCDSPAFLACFDALYVEGRLRKIESARPHKEFLLTKLAGCDTVEAAMALVGKTVAVDASLARAQLPPDRYFIRDLIGCRVWENGIELGKLVSVLCQPAHDVYVVRGPQREWMIPVVDEFVKSIDLKTRVITVQTIEGMSDETV